jgi:hypothetical protein
MVLVFHYHSHHVILLLNQLPHNLVTPTLLALDSNILYPHTVVALLLAEVFKLVLLIVLLRAIMHSLFLIPTALANLCLYHPLLVTLMLFLVISMCGWHALILLALLLVVLVLKLVLFLVMLPLMVMLPTLVSLLPNLSVLVPTLVPCL